MYIGACSRFTISLCHLYICYQSTLEHTSKQLKVPQLPNRTHKNSNRSIEYITTEIPNRWRIAIVIYVLTRRALWQSHASTMRHMCAQTKLVYVRRKSCSSLCDTFSKAHFVRCWITCILRDQNLLNLRLCASILPANYWLKYMVGLLKNSRITYCISAFGRLLRLDWIRASYFHEQ